MWYIGNICFQSIGQLKTILVEAAHRVNRLQFVYARMPPQFIQLANKVKVTPGLHREDAVISELLVDSQAILGDHVPSYRKALELLSMVVCVDTTNTWTDLLLWNRLGSKSKVPG